MNVLKTVEFVKEPGMHICQFHMPLECTFPNLIFPLYPFLICLFAAARLSQVENNLTEKSNVPFQNAAKITFNALMGFALLKIEFVMRYATVPTMMMNLNVVSGNNFTFFFQPTETPTVALLFRKSLHINIFMSGITYMSSTVYNLSDHNLKKVSVKL